MSILIKGMEMPEMCLTCPFECRGNCMVSGKDVEEFEYGGIKDINCPLIEVPTPHGRLIDADALEKDAEWSNYYNENTAYSEWQIGHAPTVIEAEDE